MSVMNEPEFDLEELEEITEEPGFDEPDLEECTVAPEVEPSAEGPKTAQFVEDDIDDEDGKEESTEVVEKKHQKFIRMSEGRINKVVDDLRKIATLANGSYEYSDEEIAKMFAYLDKAMERTKTAFEKKKFMDEFSWEN